MTTLPPPANWPFSRVLIANRGEIAIRIIRACHELGLAAVAVYAAGEEQARHVRLADDAYRLTSEAAQPYLDIAAIIAAAHRAGATAVHPGYGFLAENAQFAAACAEAGLVFVGPGPAAIRAMGDKIEARKLAVAAGLPVTAGTADGVPTVAAAREWAAANGYPVAIKAAGGGGGRGFRVARSEAELEASYAGAVSEAERSFANPTVYVERYLEQPRHVEVQVLADRHGQVAVLGDRDCSIQRRHQKLIEEAPAPGLAAALRERMAAAAIALARAVDYESAGTLEFLVTGDEFFFLEMNTRVQVEHPVTELVTGIDIVKEQLRIAAGEPLSFAPDAVTFRGHAIECRVNAEDPGSNFAPMPGTIDNYQEPGGFGVRVDSAMGPGAVISAAYDSMIAKLIVWGRDRDEAVARMRRALAEFEITGVPTTLVFHARVMADADFQAARVSTAFIADHPDVVPPPASPAASDEPAPGGSAEILAEVNGRRFMVRLPAGLGGAVTTSTDGNGAPRRQRGRAVQQTAGNGQSDLVSPIQGTVLRVVVSEGQEVDPGDVICVVEAMKMENELVAHRAGTVTALRVAPGAQVRIREVVATIE